MVIILYSNLFIILAKIRENGKHIQTHTLTFNELRHTEPVSGVSAFLSISIAVSILELNFNILTN